MPRSIRTTPVSIHAPGARLVLAMTSLAVLFAFGAGPALAQFPSRTVTLLVGFAPGGGTDTAARIIARELSVRLKQSIVVENQAGAGGNIATERAVHANPDGHFIHLSAVGPLTVAPHMVAKLPYDPRRDVVPISMGVMFANVLVVHPSVGAASVADYVRLANARPGTMGYGTSGIGSTGHLSGELFRTMAKAELVHVPYKGGGPAMTDLLGGAVPSSFASAPSALPQIKAGKIRALATTGAVRSAFLPDVPALGELYPGYDASNWYAFVGPAKMSKDIVQRWNREIVQVLSAPEMKNELFRHGMDAQPSTPEELARHIAREYEVWGRVVKQAGIQAQ